MATLTRVTPLSATDIVSDKIGDAILGGDFEPGSQLPSEKDLVKMLGVSRSTLRESLRRLEEQGLITRRHGVGTFVRSQPILKNMSLNYGLSEMISSAGYAPGYCHLDVREEPADEAAVENLHVDRGDVMVVVEMVQTADGDPVAYSVEITPRSIFVDAAAGFMACENPSVFGFLQSELGISIHHGIARLSPVTADRALAKHLKVDEGAALLYHFQVDYLSNDQPVILSHVYHIAGAFEMVVYRTRPPGAANSPI